LTHHDQDLSTDDQELVTKYGILTDTVAVVVVTPDAPVITRWCPPPVQDGGCALELVILKGRARYAISPAAAQLGVSCFGFLDVATSGFGRNIALLLQHVATAFCGCAREAAAEKSPTKTWFQGNWLKELETKIFPTLRIPTDSQGTKTQYTGTRLITSTCWLTSDDIEAVLGKARAEAGERLGEGGFPGELAGAGAT
jgi:hypothetical protein